MSAIQDCDPEVAAIIADEERRQVDSLEMIASENYASAAVLEATGSVFTNKYAEGYPGKRYYAGNQHSDRLETLAIERAKALFHVEH
ncbi:serine hydroxymethyltransferase, partial [bacterium]